MTTITIDRATVEQALEALTAHADLLGTMYLKMDAITALRTALAQQAEPVKQVKTCAWRANLDAIYETECGNLHIVNDGTLEENGMKYCCYCGKEIEDESPT